MAKKKRTRKRPSPEQAEQPATKRISTEQPDEYKTVNAAINPAVQMFSRGGLPQDDMLANILVNILSNAPPSTVYLKIAECKELITAHPDLKEAVQSAISRQRYEDVISLRRYLRASVTVPTYNPLPASNPPKRSATRHFGSPSIGG